MNIFLLLLLIFPLLTFSSSNISDKSVKQEKELEKKITLHEAVKSNNKVLVESLIKSGANINQKNSKATSPLHIAAFYGYLDIVKLLVEHGAELNLKDAQGYTPLDDALLKAHIEVVAYLLRKNAEYTTRSKGVRLDFSLPDNTLGMLVTLLNINEGVPNEAKFKLDRSDSTILHVAARNNYNEVVRLVAARVCAQDLLDLLASVDKEGNTPLKLALTNHNPSCDFVKLLLDYDAPVFKEYRTLIENKNLPEILKLLDDKVTALGSVLIFTDLKEHEKALSALSYYRGGGICCDSYENPYWWYGHSPLTQAASRSNLKKVMELVNAGVEINKKNYWGKTAFIEAANAGSLEIVEYLKAQGALINPDELGEALYNAASSGNKDLLKFLLANGVSPNKVSTKYLSCVLSIRSPLYTDHTIGEPALFGAARNGRLDCIDLLLAAGADINMTSSEGWSLLECLFDVYKLDDQRRSKFYNSTTGYGPVQFMECVPYLIDKGARVSSSVFCELLKVTAEWLGLPDYEQEQIKAAKQLLEFLESKKDILTQKIDNLEDLKNLPELHSALKNKDSKKVRRILRKKPESIYDRDKDNNTALMYALKAEEPKLIALILKQITDGNASNNRNQTALSIATDIGNTKILKMLLDSRKIDVNASCEGMPVLEKIIISELAEEKKLKLAKLLLDAGADPNTLLGEGETVLALAVRAGNVPLIKLLLAKGAFTNIKNGGGVTPLARAVWDSNVEIARLLLEHGANPNCEGSRDSVFCDVIEYNNAEMIQLFLEKGVDVHTSGSFISTPLHYAAEKGNIKAVELLLKYGAQFGPTTYKIENEGEWKLNNFPLCQAIKEGHSDIVKLLLEKGADWLEKDFTGKTAREYALESENPDVRELFGA